VTALEASSPPNRNGGFRRLELPIYSAFHFSLLATNSILSSRPLSLRQLLGLFIAVGMNILRGFGWNWGLDNSFRDGLETEAVGW
jgi:hypothetical protein